MAMFTMNLTGNKVKLAKTETQLSVKDKDMSANMIVSTYCADWKDGQTASTKCTDFTYTEMPQTRGGYNYVRANIVAMREATNYDWGIVFYSFTMTLQKVPKSGATSHDDWWYKFVLPTSYGNIGTQQIMQIYVQKNRENASGGTGGFVVWHNAKGGNYTEGYICCDTGNDEADAFDVDVLVVTSATFTTD